MPLDAFKNNLAKCYIILNYGFRRTDVIRFIIQNLLFKLQFCGPIIKYNPF